MGWRVELPTLFPSSPLPSPTWFKKICGGIFLHCFLTTVNFVVILIVLSYRCSYIYFPWLTRWTLSRSFYSLSSRALTVDNEEDTWSLTLQRGVTSAARHGENITCRGVTSTARHAARSHSFDYISTTGRKCNRAALYVFTKELARLWCGRQFLQIISSFFSLLSKFGWFSFCSP